jgi:hypothetical protein
MKSLLTYLLILTAYSSLCQESKLNKNLEDYFKDYTTAIINNNLESELELMHPALFKNHSREEINIEYNNSQSKKDTTQVSKKNQLIVIKNITESTFKKGNEYRIIDYIIIREVEFKKEIYQNMKKEDSISKIKEQRFDCNVPFTGRDKSVQPLTFDENKKMGLYAHHERILAIRESESKKWWFISKKWCNFNPLPKSNKNTSWSFPIISQIINVSNINEDIPSEIIRIMREKTGYNTVYN